MKWEEGAEALQREQSRITKRIIPFIVLSCVLCLLAACGPQGTTSSNADSSSPEDSAADSSSSLPADVSEIKLNDESDIKTMLEGTPGLEMREFYGAGTYHSMYVLDYLCEDTANNQWVYQLYVQPFKYSNNIGNVIPGIMITAVGPDKDEVQLEDAFATLRYADGFSHNGILDVDAVAAQES